ncbi:MAG: peptidylprolyl isomerase [Elusimicrobiaceae bacterium]|nr:peptidylprolyl isomerase [Elusimicrobiaceae bacterium]
MIQKGAKVKFDYTLTVDGKVQDTSAGRGPLEYTHGAGQIIKGLEEVLEQMNVGDKKTVKIAAEKAYGPVLEEAIKRVPKTAIMNADQLKIGDMVGASNAGHTFRAIVKEISDQEITLDFNHPLAGKELTFEVEVKEINQ